MYRIADYDHDRILKCPCIAVVQMNLRKQSGAYSEYKSMNAMRTTMMIKNSKKPIPMSR